MFGLGWFQRRHENKLHWNTQRTQILYALPYSPREYLDPLSRTEIARRVEGLMEMFGMVKEGGAGIARHTVGTGLTLQSNCDDTDWNRDAEADFFMYSVTPSRCDVANRRDFYDAQNAAIEQQIWRGEFLAQDVDNPRWDGAPAFQIFDTTEIETPTDAHEDPSIYDGVRLGEFNEPLGYYQRYGEGKYRELPANKVTHLYEPTGINQVRGQSAFSPVVDKLVDWADLDRLVTQTAKTHSALAIAVKKLAKAGGRGAFNAIKGAAGTAGAGEPAVNTQALEKAFPGMVAYLGQDGEVQLVNSQTPNDKLEPFLTKLVAPDVFLALGVPSEYFWNPTAAGGTAQRFILQRADARFRQLADRLIYRWCNRVAFRYLSWRIQTGMLRAPTDPNWAAKLTWQQPARVTVDNGRDGKLEIEQLANGCENLRGVWDRRGRGYREETRQWLREWKEFLTEAEKMKLPEWVQQRWRAGAPGAGMGAAPDAPPAGAAVDPLGKENTDEK